SDLCRQIERSLQRYAAVADLVAERLTVDHFRCDEGGVAVNRDVEDGDDVGMVERAGGARLGHETLQPIGIDRGTAMQDLERHFALEPRIPRAIHFAAAPAPEQLENLVGS